MKLWKRIVKLWGQIVKLALWNSEDGLWNSGDGLWNLWSSEEKLWNSWEGLWNWYCDSLLRDGETLGGDCFRGTAKLCRQIRKLWHSKFHNQSLKSQNATSKFHNLTWKSLQILKLPPLLQRQSSTFFRSATSELIPITSRRVAPRTSFLKVFHH